MGQAKQRGSYEARVVESQERRRAEREVHNLRLAEEEAARTPEERQERAKAKARLATMLAFAYTTTDSI